jgi:hypothetical protein
MLGIRNLIVTATITAIGLAVGRAEAAPQILGLLASNGIPTPLHCRDGDCTGYFASFCLQEARDAPSTGQEYKLAPGGALMLIATQLDGRRLKLRANDLLTIRLRSGFSSVRISLPEARLNALGIGMFGANSLAVEVEPETTILPVVALDDPDPQSPQEITQAFGPLRHLAAKIFDGSGEIPDTARLVGLLINALPPEDDPGPVGLDALFRQVVASVGSGRFGSEGFAAAESIVEGCQPFPPTSIALGFCLESRQNGLLATLNSEFWDTVGGS